MKFSIRHLIRFLKQKPLPTIQSHTFQKRNPALFAAVQPNPLTANLVSQVCRYDALESSRFRNWIAQLNEPWFPHRKLWELAFICEALSERNLLNENCRGLGFAVGTEKLPALFASMGCDITATDLPINDDRNDKWAKTNQYTGSLDGLNKDKLCPQELFSKKVTFQPVDMNHIPASLRDYDFTWSTCSFEHCGNIELGLRFLEHQMACLKPGGIAVHTTEFNLTSNQNTCTKGDFVIYRLCDIEAIIERLKNHGHAVEPIDVHSGDHVVDQIIDQPPYSEFSEMAISKRKHMRLNLKGFVSTSIALIIKKSF